MQMRTVFGTKSRPSLAIVCLAAWTFACTSLPESPNLGVTDAAGMGPGGRGGTGGGGVATDGRPSSDAGGGAGGSGGSGDDARVSSDGQTGAGSDSAGAVDGPREAGSMLGDMLRGDGPTPSTDTTGMAVDGTASVDQGVSQDQVSTIDVSLIPAVDAPAGVDAPAVPDAPAEIDAPLGIDVDPVGPDAPTGPDAPPPVELDAGGPDPDMAPTCGSGTHVCESMCASNLDTKTCGSSCTPCPVPLNGSATCDGMACGVSCTGNFKACMGACIATTSCCMASECPVPMNGVATCASGMCGFTCNMGYHPCGAACVSNMDVATCGPSSCTACVAPTGGGTVTCNGTACVPACPPGKQLCMGACIDMGLACAGTCPMNQRACPDTFCKPNDVTACGASCSVCPVPANGAATCDGVACGFTCTSGYKKCGTSCIPDASCCTDPDCPLVVNGTVTCDNGTCKTTCNTAMGYKACNAACIPNANCCVDRDCANPSNGVGVCTAGTCGVSCNLGYQGCNATCILNSACCSPADCMAPPNGTATCQTNMCGFTCTAPHRTCPLTCPAPGNCCADEFQVVDVDNNYSPDCQQNLLSNAQFASTANLWTAAPPNLVTTWRPADANGSASSGSLEVNFAQTTSVNSVSGATQCVRITGAQNYSVFGRYFIPSGQGVAGNASVQVLTYASLDCTGANNGVYNSPSWGAGTDVWTPGAFSFTAPALAASARVRLNVTKPGGSGAFSILYDNVLFRPGDLCPGLIESVDLDVNIPDCLQTMVRNAQFTDDVNDWSSADGGLSWEGTADASMSPNSGSATLKNGLGAAGTVVAVQCVRVQPSKAYAIYGRTFITAGQGVVGSAQLGARSFATTDCSGPSTKAENNAGSTTTGAWVTQSAAYTTSATAQSVWVELRVTKPNALTFYAFFDNILVR